MLIRHILIICQKNCFSLFYTNMKPTRSAFFPTLLQFLFTAYTLYDKLYIQDWNLTFLFRSYLFNLNMNMTIHHIRPHITGGTSTPHTRVIKHPQYTKLLLGHCIHFLYLHQMTFATNLPDRLWESCAEFDLTVKLKYSSHTLAGHKHSHVYKRYMIVWMTKNDWTPLMPLPSSTANLETLLNELSSAILMCFCVDVSHNMLSLALKQS